MELIEGNRVMEYNNAVPTAPQNCIFRLINQIKNYSVVKFREFGEGKTT
jgi:hypothetical protein